MARLEAEVTANIGPFERALSKATEEAREFAHKTTDIGKDVFKESAGGGLFKLTGMAGGAAAMTAGLVGIIDFAKEGIKEFGHLQSQLLQLKYNLKDPSVANEVHEWIESIASGGGGLENLHNAFISLSESGLNLEKSKEVLLDLQAVALKSGTSVNELAEAFRKAKAGGLDAGEGASRLLKSLPGLSVEIDKQKQKMAVLAEENVGVWDPAKMKYSHMEEAKAQAKELREMTPAEFVKRGLLNTETLEKMLHQMAPREMVAERKTTFAGMADELEVQVGQLKEAFGHGLMPAILDLIAKINANLPTLQKSFDDFGAEMGKAITFMQSLIPTKDTIAKTQSTLDKIDAPVQAFENMIAEMIGAAGKPVGTQASIDKTAGHAENSVKEQQTTNSLLENIQKGLDLVYSGG